MPTTPARHACLTFEKLDFTINYDIKYRMGRRGADHEADWVKC
jgi:hypothetical protein